jgi:hypothetical protein
MPKRSTTLHHYTHLQLQSTCLMTQGHHKWPQWLYRPCAHTSSQTHPARSFLFWPVAFPLLHGSQPYAKRHIAAHSLQCSHALSMPSMPGHAHPTCEVPADNMGCPVQRAHTYPCFKMMQPNIMIGNFLWLTHLNSAGCTAHHLLEGPAVPLEEPHSIPGALLFDIFKK